MKNYLLSAAIGDIAGSAYEGRTHRVKDSICRIDQDLYILCPIRLEIMNWRNEL